MKTKNRGLWIILLLLLSSCIAVAVFDPVAGRWTQRDPIDYADGENLYQFNHNNPINAVDSLGLFTWDKQGNIKVEKGDTISQISSYTGIPQSVLKSVNQDKERIRVGQTLVLPEERRVKPGQSYTVSGVKVTAYCSCAICCNKAKGAGDGKTSTGSKACQGTLAVDSHAIPMGSTISITTADGRQITGTAKDTGSRIKGKKIDVWFADHDTATRFGVKTATITITRATH